MQNGGKMKLHNKIEITFGDGRRFECFNTLLNGIITELAGLSKWNNFFVFGSGGSATVPGQTSLEAPLFALESSISASNISPEKGVLFVTKQVVFDESDSREFNFSEVGISKVAGENPTCFSRFLLTDGDGNVLNLTRRAGESLVVAVTVFLTTEGSTCAFTAGENLLAEVFLGIRELSAGERVAKIADGLSLAGGNEIVDRSELDGLGVTATLSGGSGGIVISASATLSTSSHIELVLSLAGRAVLRFFAGSTATTTDYVTSGSAHEIMLSKKYVTKVKRVNDITTNTLYLDFGVTSFTNTCGAGNISPFDYPYPQATFARYYAKDGKKIAFVGNSRIDIYHSVEGVLRRVDTSEVVFRSGLQDIYMYGNFMIVHYHQGTASFLDYYYLQNFKYTPKTINISIFEGGFPKFLQFEVAYGRGHYFVFGYLTSLPGIFQTLVVYIDHEFNLYSTFASKSSTESTYDRLFGFSSGDYIDGCIIGFGTSGGTRFLRKFYSAYSATVSSAHVTAVFTLLSGVPSVAGRFVISRRTDGSICYFDARTYTSFVVTLSGADCICVDTSGKYILKYISGVPRVYYINENNAFIQFSNSLPSNVTALGFTWVFMMDDVMIYERTVSPHYATVSLPKTHTKVIANYSAGHSMEVTYDYVSEKSGTNALIRISLE